MSRLVKTTALCLALAAGPALAQEEAAPTMSPTMITQDTMATSGDILVPILALIFIALVLHGGGGSSYVAPT